MSRFLKAVVLFIFVGCQFYDDTPVHNLEVLCMTTGFLPQPFPPFPPQDRGGQASPHPTSDWGLLARGKTLGKRTVHTGVSSFQAGFSPVDILTLQGEDEYALNLNVCLCPPQYFEGTIPANPQDLSMSQSNLEIPNTQTAQVPRVFAIVDWGIGGVSNRAEVDFSNGTNINLAASWLRVRGSLDTESITGNRFDAYVLSAFVGPGIPRNIAPQRTHFDFVTANSRSLVQPVPAFAKSVSGVAWVDNTDPPTILAPTIVFYMANRAGVAASAADVIGYWILTPNVMSSIPSNAAFFQVINPDAANAMRVNTTFELAL